MFQLKALSIRQGLKLHNSNKMLINFSHYEKKSQFRKFSSFRTIRNQVNNDRKDSSTCSDVNNYSAVLIIEKESTERFVDDDNTPILKEILESPPGKGPIIAVLPHSSIPFETIRMIGVSKFVTEGLEQYREKDEQFFEKSNRLLAIFPISLILGVLLVVGTFFLTRTNLTEEEFEILIEKARNQLKQMVNPSTNEAKQASDQKVWHYFWNDIKKYPAVYGLIALNLLAYRYTRNRAHQSVDLSFFKTFYKTFTLTPHNFLSGRHYCTISAAFIHSNAKHLFSNMAGLLIFGSQVCDDLGIGTFLALYFGAVITSSIGSLIGLFMVSLFQSSIGASGAVFALAAAFLCLKDDKDSALYLKMLVGFLVAEFLVVRFGFSNHDPFTHKSTWIS